MPTTAPQNAAPSTPSNQKPGFYAVAMATWMKLGPILVLILTGLAAVYPAHAVQFHTAAIVAASMLGGHLPPPLLNGQGLGRLASAIQKRQTEAEIEKDATHPS